MVQRPLLGTLWGTELWEGSCPLRVRLLAVLAKVGLDNVPAAESGISTSRFQTILELRRLNRNFKSFHFEWNERVIVQAWLRLLGMLTASLLEICGD